ncbi:hypothetical protein ACHAWF_009826, partial [Thalassiosira exigua]
MTPQDLAACRDIVTRLSSEEHREINRAFLEPVDPNVAPDHTSIIKRPMDLRTLSKKLESGAYATKAQFYDDTQLIFDNAVQYNEGTRNDTIAAYARRPEAVFRAMTPIGERSGSDPAGLTDQEKKEKEQFLMFTMVLMKYLELKDSNMHSKAKAQIKECYEKNKSGDPMFKSLTISRKSARRSLAFALHATV